LKLNIGKSPASIGWRKTMLTLISINYYQMLLFTCAKAVIHTQLSQQVIPIPVVVLTSGIEVAAATQSSVFV
jgi:hypothetical protein